MYTLFEVVFRSPFGKPFFSFFRCHIQCVNSNNLPIFSLFYKIIKICSMTFRAGPPDRYKFPFPGYFHPSIYPV